MHWYSVYICNTGRRGRVRKPYKGRIIYFIYFYLFRILRRFQHCTGHITTGSWKDRGNQYIQLVKVVYCKLLTNGKQLPAFPLEVGPGTELRSRRLEARVIPLCHCGHKGGNDTLNRGEPCCHIFLGQGRRPPQQPFATTWYLRLKPQKIETFKHSETRL